METYLQVFQACDPPHQSTRASPCVSSKRGDCAEQDVGKVDLDLYSDSMVQFVRKLRWVLHNTLIPTPFDQTDTISWTSRTCADLHFHFMVKRMDEVDYLQICKLYLRRFRVIPVSKFNTPASIFVTILQTQMKHLDNIQT